MSATFTKLFTSITESTIWCEPSDIRVVWITMLAMADKNGRVWASVPGLANRAQVSLQAAEEALEKFQSPDPYSRTPDHEGRRIAPIDGGWMLLNHAKHRAIQDDEERKAYKREWIKKKRSEGKGVDNDVDNVDESRHQYTQADTDTDTDIDIKTKENIVEQARPPTKETVKLEEITQIFNHWKNRLGHSRAQLTESRRKVIAKARKSGYSIQDCMTAIDGCAATPFNLGENDRGERYDSIELILRDAPHIDRFMRHAKNPPRPMTKADMLLANNARVAQEFLAEDN